MEPMGRRRHLRVPATLPCALRHPPQDWDGVVVDISVGGALARHVLATFVDASRAMREHGSFAWMRATIGWAEVAKLLRT